MDTFDVTIIGAGVSGLTCARHLLDQGRSVRLLEARSRIGGRIHTPPFAGNLPHPPELGAEFIHGAPPILLDLLEELRIAFIDVPDSHLFLKNKKLHCKNDFWEQLEKLTDKLNPKLKQDRSVATFLRIHGAEAAIDVRRLFAAYVEGFQAADLNFMSEKSLAENEQAEEKSLGPAELFRPHGGYTAVFEHVLESHPKLKNAVLLNAVAKNLEWKPGSAEVQFKRGSKTYRVNSRAVVITLPIGVLKSSHPKSALKITPEIPALTQGLSALEMGHVQRITFEFKTRFWEKLSDELVSFMHTGPEEYFPTWWTQLSVRSPYLMAWQGGPKALELSQKSADERVAIALKTLAKLTGRSRAFLRDQLVQSFSHDWSHDPFSLGAYSYTGLANEISAARLRIPFHQTIILAGEATAQSAPAQGTVHGAMESGLRAGKQAQKLLNR